MNTITHALLPLIAAAVFEKSYRPKPARRGNFTTKSLLLIGLFGAAPDLLNPHFSLAARYTSWSHGLPFWFALTLVIGLTSIFYKHKCSRTLALWLSSAYLLHLFCDAISGGIAWLYPFLPDTIGAYYIPATYWIPLDALCILTCYILFRILPNSSQK